MSSDGVVYSGDAMVVTTREMVAGDKDAIESCRRLRNQHHGECAVDLASSCTYEAAPFRHVPMPPAMSAEAAASSARKRPRVVVADETPLFRSDATSTDDVDDPALLLRRVRWKQGLEAVKTAVAWRLAAKDDEIRRMRQEMAERLWCAHKAKDDEIRRTRQEMAERLRCAHKAKDDEIRRTRQEMAEHLRCACAVSRAWQNIAMAREGDKAALQSENTALRAELGHVLRAKPRWHDDDDADAESCCYGDNFTTGGKEEDEGGGGTSTAARCFGCGERACCWHLCAATAWACPACGYANMDDAHVNHYMVYGGDRITSC